MAASANVVDVDDDVAVGPEHDELVVQREARAAEHPAGRVQRLVEIVGAAVDAGSGHRRSMRTSR